MWYGVWAASRISGRGSSSKAGITVGVLMSVACARVLDGNVTLAQSSSSAVCAGYKLV